MKYWRPLVYYDSQASKAYDAIIASYDRMLGEVHYYTDKNGKPLTARNEFMPKLRRSFFKLFKCSKCGIRPNRYWAVKTDYLGPGGVHTLIHRYCLICCFTKGRALELQVTPECSQSEKHGQLTPVK